MDSVIVNFYNNLFTLSAMSLFGLLLWRVWCISGTLCHNALSYFRLFWSGKEPDAEDTTHIFQLAMAMIFFSVGIRIGYWAVATLVPPVDATYPAWAVENRTLLWPTGFLFLIGCIMALGSISWLVQRLRWYLLGGITAIAATISLIF